MNKRQEQRQVENILRLIDDLCGMDAWYGHGDRIDMTLTPRSTDLPATADIIGERLTRAGYYVSIIEQDKRLLLQINSRRRFRVPRLNILLFVLTLLSIYFFPVFESNRLAVEVDMVQKGVKTPQTWSESIHLVRALLAQAWTGTIDDLKSGRGLIFTLALMSILLVHEIGHYLAGRRRGLASSWPYFIPAPMLMGTLGTVTRSKIPFWNRRDLIEVGAAGPIAGWVVAVGWLVYGLSYATVIEADAASVKSIAFYLDGESLLVKGLTPLLAGQAPLGFVYIFPETAFAGWVGVLVTALNLLPIGQFDGGRIVYGLLPDMQRRLAWLAMVALVALGLQNPVWWIIAAMGFLFRVGHPPTMQDHLEPGRPAVIMGITAMIILILSFTPVPFR